jgi:anti-anti-sigma factor
MDNMDKILIIDDERPILTMFELFLGTYGYEVHTAENGQHGLEVFKRERPQIVLTDIKMPGMDGLEVLRRIKAIDPLTEVIVITGHGDMDIAIKALNLNATDFINKPIEDNALDAALSRARERLHLARHKEEEVISGEREGVAYVRIRGNLTSRSEPFLISEFDKAAGHPSNRILLNFDENSSINGAGIAVLIQLLSRSEKRGQAVAISGLSENFRKVFGMVGITSLATIYESEEEALAALRAS